MYRENGWTNTNRKHTEMTIQVNKNNRWWTPKKLENIRIFPSRLSILHIKANNVLKPIPCLLYNKYYTQIHQILSSGLESAILCALKQFLGHGTTQNIIFMNILHLAFHIDTVTPILIYRNAIAMQASRLYNMFIWQ
jgi:hypothetical protein